MIILDTMGHMVSTESEEKTHEFAKKLGLKRGWYHEAESLKRYHPHYDLTTRRMKKRAVRLGAKPVKASELLKIAWWANPISHYYQLDDEKE